MFTAPAAGESVVAETPYTLTWDATLLKYFERGEGANLGYEAVSENVTIFLVGSADDESERPSDRRFSHITSSDWLDSFWGISHVPASSTVEPVALRYTIFSHVNPFFAVYNMTLGATNNTGSLPVTFPTSFNTALSWYMLIFSAENTAVWSWSPGLFFISSGPSSQRKRECYNFGRWRATVDTSCLQTLVGLHSNDCRRLKPSLILDVLLCYDLGGSWQRRPGAHTDLRRGTLNAIWCLHAYFAAFVEALAEPQNRCKSAGQCPILGRWGFLLHYLVSWI